jgi:hypothetical protein
MDSSSSTGVQFHKKTLRPKGIRRVTREADRLLGRHSWRVDAYEKNLLHAPTVPDAWFDVKQLSWLSHHSRPLVRHLSTLPCRLIGN